ncbi:MULTISPECIES: CBU_0592 family membrane protein [Campylobacter]|uniref:Membrane protein n=1 Tax=Campylobacter curvus (strain 525.92) TaxID=360105 RepID=A7GZ21_CAMC5|nr:MULTISPECIES: hypothetical protein [Campylobacter]EAT99558.2 putative membrane protein [Campylobacter curvus 525.92]EJP74317.1 hypothetical protein HMPREF1139_1080 [Campylobacter sp. FOBRC14]QKF61450.1 putative membrane protein [Campylobacter curvus]UEB49759.1 hypothetical protein LK426_09095 [Campylobacter curvus]
MDIFQFIGLVGMICIVLGYLLLQLGRLTSEHMSYQLLNLAGAVLLTVSLLVHFNLGSFLIEVFWIGITIYGIFKIYRRKI